MKKQIEALKKLISVKDETIKELERQIQVLKNQPPIYINNQPVTISTYPTNPINPWQQPNYPSLPYETWITCENKIPTDVILNNFSSTMPGNLVSINKNVG